MRMMLHGAEELEKAMEMLPERMRRTALDSAASAGAIVFRKDMRRRVKEQLSGTGGLMRSIKNAKNKRVKGAQYIYTEKGGHGNFAHWFEYGTTARRPLKREGKPAKGEYRLNKQGKKVFMRLVKFPPDEYRWVQHTGQIIKRPFFRPSLTDYYTQKKSSRAIAERLLKRLTAEGKKLSTDPRKFYRKSKSARRSLAT